QQSKNTAGCDLLSALTARATHTYNVMTNAWIAMLTTLTPPPTKVVVTCRPHVHEHRINSNYQIGYRCPTSPLRKPMKLLTKYPKWPHGFGTQKRCGSICCLRLLFPHAHSAPCGMRACACGFNCGSPSQASALARIS